MKRVLCLLTVFLLVIALACPVFAAEGFVPSISEKEEPEIVPDEEGFFGAIRDKAGNIIARIMEGCLVVTPISKAEIATEIPDAARQTLLHVYKALTEGDMVLPYELDGLKSENMVIRDLIDATWLCSDHPEILEPEGVTLELTFDIGVDDDIPVYVYTYKNEDWSKAISVKNNGDGTVTVAFEHLCPIAFCVPADANVPPAQTGDAFGIHWVVLMVVSAAALCVMLVLHRRKSA